MDSGRGMTLKQFQKARFYNALEAFRTAIQSGDAKALVTTSLAVYAARRSKADHTTIRRVFRTTLFTP